MTPREEYRFGPFTLDVAERELRRDNEVVGLTAKTFDLLLILVRGAQRTFTKSELVEALWPDTAVEESNLTQTVFMLRKALGDEGSTGHILTVPRRGYKFITPVEAPISGSPSAERAAAPRNWRIPLWTLAALIAVTAVAGSTALWYAKTSGARSGHIRSIAVLPLRNLTGSPEQDYLASGLTEVLTTSIGQISALNVIAASSARQYGGTGMTVTQIARELNVDAVVEGAIQRAGNRVLITAQLVDGPSQRQLWAKSFERDVQDVLGLQNEVAAANAQLGDVYGILSLIRLLPQKETYPKWRAAVTRALELDDTLAAAHRSLADLLFYHDWNWKDAEREFLVAIRMDPNSADAHAYANLLGSTGRLDQALEETRKSVQLDPLSGGNHFALGGALLALRRNDEAIVAAREAIDLGKRLAAEQKSPILAKFLIENGHLMIGQAEEAKGDFQKAIAEFQQSGTGNIRLARAYALAGRRKEALQMVAALNPARIAGMDMAAFYAAIGDKDKAFEWLEEGYDERPSFTAGIKAESRLDSLRSDPRFADMLRRMGLPQ